MECMTKTVVLWTVAIVNPATTEHFVQEIREMLALGTVERATEKDQTDGMICRHSVRS